jgi:hypothetical protein
MEQLLDILQKANFRANLRKCYFGESKTDYVGYEITRDGIQPQPNQVEAILMLGPPKTKRQLRHFLGMIMLIPQVRPAHKYPIPPHDE